MGKEISKSKPLDDYEPFNTKYTYSQGHPYLGLLSGEKFKLVTTASGNPNFPILARVGRGDILWEFSNLRGTGREVGHPENKDSIVGLPLFYVEDKPVFDSTYLWLEGYIEQVLVCFSNVSCYKKIVGKLSWERKNIEELWQVLFKTGPVTVLNNETFPSEEKAQIFGRRYYEKSFVRAVQTWPPEQVS